MSCDYVLEARSLTKAYQLFKHPRDRLFSLIPGLKRLVKPPRLLTALGDLTFSLAPGEVVGIVGRNGAGKSTFLQLAAGILYPTSGDVKVKGRVAALLELGAGFDNRFSGRENIFLNGTLLGLSQEEIKLSLEDIIQFSGLKDQIDQPISTYSSGMVVRLAFSVATSFRPDLLIIDEALSVGDGAFAKKSFDRIMWMREQGVSILFCSHATYHVDAICDRVLWLENGQSKMLGDTADVLELYNRSLFDSSEEAHDDDSREKQSESAQIILIEVSIGQQQVSKELIPIVKSLDSSLTISISGWINSELEAPNIGVVINDVEGRNITSCGTNVDGVDVSVNKGGDFRVDCNLPNCPLLRGIYELHVFLLCERGVYIYDSRLALKFKVTQEHESLGVFRIPHTWSVR